MVRVVCFHWLKFLFSLYVAWWLRVADCSLCWAVRLKGVSPLLWDWREFNIRLRMLATTSVSIVLFSMDSFAFVNRVKPLLVFLWSVCCKDVLP